VSCVKRAQHRLLDGIANAGGAQSCFAMRGGGTTAIAGPFSRARTQAPAHFFMDKTLTGASALRLCAFFFSYFFCVYFSVHGKVFINSYLQVTLPRLFSRIRWSFHTSYRVSLVPAESDRYGAYSAGAVAARRQNGVAVAHTEGVGSRSSAWTPRTEVRGSRPSERSACNMTQLP